MPAASVLRPHEPAFERFLFAPVGRDGNGVAVTVLSTLARLGLDPWTEAAELAALGREAARVRLGRLLQGFRDVPALGEDHGSVAGELCLLLPEVRRDGVGLGGGFGGGAPAGPAVAPGGIASLGMVWLVLAIVIVVMQLMPSGLPGAGQ